MSAESTRTLLFGLFVLADRPGLTASEVVRLAEPFGIPATNVRSHLSRMVADGSLTRSGSTRSSIYAPSRSKRHVIDVIERRSKTIEEPWHGDWVVVVLPRGLARHARRRIDRRLSFDGFRPWETQAYVRPAWPADWTMERARRHAETAGGLCIRGALVTPMSASDVARAFRLDALDREARKLLAWIREHDGRGKDPARALAARAEVGGRIARFLSADPQLPPELWGKRTAVRRLVDAFGRFEERVNALSMQHVDRLLEEVDTASRTATRSRKSR